MVALSNICFRTSTDCSKFFDFETFHNGFVAMKIAVDMDE